MPYQIRLAEPKEYLPNLEVYILSENQEAKGFASAAEGNLEMKTGIQKDRKI